MNKDLTVGNPTSVLWKFCLPLFGSIIFQQLYNIADSFVAGKFIGENALAAVGNSYEITLIFIAFAFGCNIGCSVIVSQLFGAKKLGEMKTAVYTTFISSAVLCAVLSASNMWALLLALGGAAVMFGVAKKVCPPRVVEHEVPFHTGSGDVDEMLADIQQKLDALHALNEALPDPELSAAMTRMEKAGRSIMETVEASPAKAKQVRRFANYYLPDAVNVLEQYAKLARQGVRGENAASIRAEVERNAASIATAFENQLDALYAAESMDLSADLTVLQNMLKGQGLG